MPARAGSGATTIACHLAFQFRREPERKVLLADMDPVAGTLGFMLDLTGSGNPVRGAAPGSTLHVCDGVDILLTPDDFVYGLRHQRDARAVLRYSRQNYDIAVIDTGGAFGDWNIRIARECEDLVVVTTTDEPALNAAKRTLAYLGDNGIEPGKIRLVVNRHMEGAGPRRDGIEAALRMPVFHFVPNDFEAIRRALIEGKPAIPGSAFGEAIAELAARLVADQ